MMAIDFSKLILDEEVPDFTAAPTVLKRRRGKSQPVTPYVPNLRLDWFLAASYAVTGAAQLRYAVLLYRQWVITGKDEVVASTALAGLRIHGGANRVKREALAKLAAAGLIEVVTPARGNCAPRVRLLFPMASPQ
jgi:hypothetical protein